MVVTDTILSKEEIQTRIAKRVAQELENNTLVNLGIGLPTKVANYIPEDVTITLQSENGFVGLTGLTEDHFDPTIVNAGDNLSESILEVPSLIVQHHLALSEEDMLLLLF